MKGASNLKPATSAPGASSSARRAGLRQRRRFGALVGGLSNLIAETRPSAKVRVSSVSTPPISETSANRTPACEVIILAGGLSSRMGRDKARLRLGGRSTLAHIRATARRLGLPVRVVRRDLVPRCGPLGGIYTAFRRSRAEVLLFLSCDEPFVSAELLREILRKFSRPAKALFVRVGRTVGFPCVVRRAALPGIERQLARKDLSLQSLARRLQARRMRLAPVRAAELFNVNTPADWAEARRRWHVRSHG